MTGSKDVLESGLKLTKTRCFISLAVGQDEEVDLCCKDHNLQQLGFSGLLELKHFPSKVLTVHSSTLFFVSDLTGDKRKWKTIATSMCV